MNNNNNSNVINLLLSIACYDISIICKNNMILTDFNGHLCDIFRDTQRYMYITHTRTHTNLDTDTEYIDIKDIDDTDRDGEGYA